MLLNIHKVSFRINHGRLAEWERERKGEGERQVREREYRVLD